MVQPIRLSSMTSTPEGRLALRPHALAWGAALLVGLESLALLAIAAVYIARAVTGQAPADAAIAIAALVAVAAAALGAALWGLLRGARWPRGLIVTWQLLQVAAGALLVQWSWAWGLAAIAAGLGAMALTLAHARAAEAQDSEAQDSTLHGGNAPGA